MQVEGVVSACADGFEIAGVVAMVAGSLVALGLATAGVVRRRGPHEIFRNMRQRVGRGILLGLEFLVAADILRTITTIPSLERVAILAAIVAIRTFLSLSLEVELEGRWPWQEAKD